MCQQVLEGQVQQREALLFFRVYYCNDVFCYYATFLSFLYSTTKQLTILFYLLTTWTR